MDCSHKLVIGAARRSTVAARSGQCLCIIACSLLVFLAGSGQAPAKSPDTPAGSSSTGSQVYYNMPPPGLNIPQQMPMPAPPPPDAPVPGLDDTDNGPPEGAPEQNQSPPGFWEMPPSFSSQNQPTSGFAAGINPMGNKTEAFTSEDNLNINLTGADGSGTTKRPSGAKGATGTTGTTGATGSTGAASATGKADLPGKLQPPAVASDNSTRPKLANYDIIIEKNLFSPDRKKWVSEPPAKPGAQMAKKELNDLTLLGTIISGNQRYAVLRTKKETAAQSSMQPYAKGDYVQGYFIKDIEEKKVTLLDETENLMYVVFINDQQKVRVAEKTERKPEPPKAPPEVKKPEAPAAAPKRPAPPNAPGAAAPPPPDVPEAVRQPARGRRMPPLALPENMRQALDQAEEQEE